MTTKAEVLNVDGLKALVDVFGILRPTNSTDSISSVSLKNLSNGGVQAEVKVFDPDPHIAMQVAEEIYNQLRQKYSF